MQDMLCSSYATEYLYYIEFTVINDLEGYKY